MAQAATYEDIERYCTKSEQRMTLVLRFFMPFLRFVLSHLALRLINETVPAVLEYLDRKPQDLPEIKEKIEHLYAKANYILKHYDETGLQKKYSLSYPLWVEINERLQDCLECIQISSDPELIEAIQKTIPEKHTSTPDWRKELAEL